MLDFLRLKKRAFGLDLSDRSFKVAKLTEEMGELKLRSFGDFRLGEELVRDGKIKKEKELAEEIRERLPEVEGEKLRTENVVACLPEEKAFLQVIQMPRMGKKELKQAVRFEAEKYIPVPREKVYLDFEIVKPVVDNLDHRDVLISAIPKTVTDSYTSLFRKAGLQPVAFETESQSIARAVIEGNRTSQRVLVIDIGATQTKFVVFAGYNIRFVSSSLISSSTFNQALVREFEVSPRKAEELKRKYGVGRKTKITFEKGEEKKEVERTEVFEALIPPLTDLLEQIENCMDYYTSHARHEHLPEGVAGIERVILCGGGANLKALEEFLSRELGVSVEAADPWVNIVGEKGEPPLGGQKSLKFTSVLGLALRAAREYD